MQGNPGKREFLPGLIADIHKFRDLLGRKTGYRVSNPLCLPHTATKNSATQPHTMSSKTLEPLEYKIPNISKTLINLFYYFFSGYLVTFS